MLAPLPSPWKGLSPALFVVSLLAPACFAQGTWVLQNPPTSPGGVSFQGQTYDSDAQRVIVYGGSGTGIGFPQETMWAWDGAAWTQLDQPRPATWPPPLTAMGLVYDTARQELVMFGGGNSGGSSDQTWVAASTATPPVQWTLKTPATVPPARVRPSMCYDPGRGRVVLHGGTGLGDTWEWDGTDWTEMVGLAPTPGLRETAAMIYDAARGVCVLFGGNVSGTRPGDTWTWDGTTWTDVTPATGNPAGREGHSLTYDSVRQTVVLFGGFDGASNRDDVWEWDGSAWTDVTSTLATRPTPRQGHGVAYDEARRQIVLYGAGPHPLNETWVMCSSTTKVSWTELSPASRPPARAKHGVAYDEGRGRAIVFGGVSTNGFVTLGDMWEWDGTSWSEVMPPTMPSARQNPAMAYDGRRGVTVLYGGTGGGDETWEYDGTDWRNVNPPNNPGGALVKNMAYDRARGVMVVFGGDFANSKTWEYDGTDWVERMPATVPPARSGHGLVYDEARARVVMFGGQVFGASAIGDTWEWDGIDWTQPTPSTSPPPRCSHTMAYDPERYTVVLFGGLPGGFAAFAFSDVWEWDGSEWTNNRPGPCEVGPVPSARWEPRLFHDQKRGAMMLFGGGESLSGPATGAQDDTWEFRGASGLMFQYTEHPVGRGPSGVVAVDGDGDGDQDFCTVNEVSMDASFSPNDGNGNFGPARTVDMMGAQGLSDVGAGDTDNDGLRDDIVAPARDSDMIVCVTDVGTTPMVTMVASAGRKPSSVAVTDLDSDPTDDVVVGREGDPVMGGGGVETIRNGGAATDIPGGTATKVVDVVAADLDGDGDNDAAAAARGTPDEVKLYDNDGAGNLSYVGSKMLATTDKVTALAVDDFDGDGDQDLMAATPDQASEAEYFEYDGSGSLDPTDYSSHVTDLGASGATDFASGDFENDSVPGRSRRDVAIVDRSGDVVTDHGFVDRRFTSRGRPRSGSRPSDVAVTDVNDDGSDDIIVANKSDDTVTVNRSVPPALIQQFAQGIANGRGNTPYIWGSGLPKPGRRYTVTYDHEDPTELILLVLTNLTARGDGDPFAGRGLPARTEIYSSVWSRLGSSSDLLAALARSPLPRDPRALPRILYAKNLDGRRSARYDFDIPPTASLIGLDAVLQWIAFDRVTDWPVMSRRLRLQVGQ